MSELAPGARLNLRFSDLQKLATHSKVMNVRVPETLLARIDRIAIESGCLKREVVTALLNAGLDEFEQHRLSPSKAR
jgi:hypothetical protein